MDAQFRNSQGLDATVGRGSAEETPEGHIPRLPPLPPAVQAISIKTMNVFQPLNILEQINFENVHSQSLKHARFGV